GSGGSGRGRDAAARQRLQGRAGAAHRARHAGGRGRAAMSAVIGQPRDRVDGRLKVTGGARYAAEFATPNLAHGVLVQSTIANGRIRAIETAAAEAAPGVLSVLTHRNAPRLQAVPASPAGYAGQSLVPLQDDRVHYQGRHIAVVVAETLQQAQHAASL